MLPPIRHGKDVREEGQIESRVFESARDVLVVARREPSRHRSGVAPVAGPSGAGGDERGEVHL